MIYARVYGVPGAQGSKSFKGTFKDKAGRVRGIMAESSKKVGPWRDAVTLAMVQASEASPVFFDCAVRLTVQFIMVRTGAEPKGWTRHHTKAPDIDKLVRSTADAITASAVWKDDSRVVELTAVKVTAEPGEAPGCVIIIEALPEKEKPHGTTKAAARASGGPRAGRAGGSGRGRGKAPGAAPGRKRPAAGDGGQYFV